MSLKHIDAFSLFWLHGTCDAKELHEFVDEWKDEVPGVARDLRLGDEDAPKDDAQEGVEHVANVA